MAHASPKEGIVLLAVRHLPLHLLPRHEARVQRLDLMHRHRDRGSHQNSLSHRLWRSDMRLCPRHSKGLALSHRHRHGQILARRRHQNGKLLPNGQATAEKLHQKVILSATQESEGQWPFGKPSGRP